MIIMRPLPGGYGQGSSTLAKWIQENLDKDAQRVPELADPLARLPQATASDDEKEAGGQAEEAPVHGCSIRCVRVHGKLRMGRERRT